MGIVEGREEIGRAIAAHRDYLLLVADRAMTPGLRTKEGASDLVQEAMMAAHQASGQFEVKTAIELRSWLRRLLLNRVAHAARRYRGTEKRRMGRELSLDAEAEGEGIADTLSIDQISPGALASRREEEARMREALDQLSERMRQAVLWRHHEGCGFEVIGRRLGCSDVAARKLWLRALDQLQRELSGDGARSAGLLID